MTDLVVIDDELDISWILQQLLEAEGYTVRVANDGRAGLRLLAERLPDLVILDVEMPELDGPSMVYQMFVHNVGMENIPIILISGDFDLSTIAARVGTPYHLAKPFDPLELTALVKRALRERALPRPNP